MSLLRLLSVGRSLVGGQNPRGRYKMSPDCRLPQFPIEKGGEEFWGSERLTSKPAAENSLFARLRRRFGKRASNAGRSIETPPGQGTNSPADEDEFEGSGGLSGTRASGQGNEGFRARIDESDSTCEGRLIQPELTLDKVQVVRNDLRDADLEIVRVGAKASQEAARTKSRPVCAVPGKAGLIWNRLTARLFVAGRSRFQ